MKFQSSSNDTNALVAYNVQNFSRKIRESFDESDLTIAAESTKKTIAYKTGITLEDAYKFAKEKNKEDKSCDVWKCALYLRDKILDTPIKPLEEPISTQSIMEGEAEIPEDVKTFFKIMYTGSSSEKDI